MSVSVWFLSAFDCGWDFGSPFPLPLIVYVCVCVLTVPDDSRMSKYPGGSSSSSSSSSGDNDGDGDGDGNGIVSASPSATTVVAIRSKRILLLSGVSTARSFIKGLQLLCLEPSSYMCCLIRSIIRFIVSQVCKDSLLKDSSDKSEVK